MVKGHPLSLAVHLEHATNLAGTKGSNGYLFSTHEGWNDTRTVKSTSTNSSRRFTVANDALEQGFALVTCIGPGLSIDLLLLYPPDVEQRRLVFYFSSIGGGGVIYRERWRLIDVSRSKVQGIGFSIASLTDASSSSNNLARNLSHE